MNLLQLIQQVCDELAINRPTLIVGTSDPQIRQLYALLNRLGNDLCRQFEWQRLNKEFILTTNATVKSATLTAGSAVVTVADTTGLTTNYGLSGQGIVPFAQIVSVDSPTQVTMTMAATESGTFDIEFGQISYALPSDWLKQIPQTEWDRTNRWPLMGPQSPQDWQSFKSGIVYAGPRERFRILGNAVVLNPPPPNGLILAYEYISNGWVESVAGVAQSSYLADTDTSIFSDSLLITGLKTQWKQAKGLDGTFDLAEFRTLLEQNKAQDKSAPRLSLSPYADSILLTEWNVQDGQFPAS